MSQQPARLTPGLVPVRKGEAAPAAVPPTPEALLQTSAQQPPEETPGTAPTPRPPASARPKPPEQPATKVVVRKPPPQVNRLNLSVRLPDEMVEWLRVRAFMERDSVQSLVEAAIAEYRQNHPE